MNLRHNLSLAAVALGIIVSAGSVGHYPESKNPEAAPIQNVSAQMDASTEIIAPNEHLTFSKPDVKTIAAPPKPVEVESDLTPAPVAPVIENKAPVVEQSRVAAPVAPDAPAKKTPAAVTREVYVGLAGGQSVVDLGRGPVLFSLGGGFPPYVAEHDAMGGWERFGTLSAGMTVRMTGLVTGTYTVGQIINVPKGGTTDEFRKFSVMPKVMLQTCVPGTKRMVVVGLY
jgi:hypothetical protein